MADNLDEVFAEPLEAVEPAPIQEPEAAVEPTPETVEEPAPIQSQPEVVEPSQQAQPGYVPLDAMLTEREKRQSLERELQQLRQTQAQPQAIPDPFDDPSGYQAHVNEQFEARILSERANTSYMLAVRDHGKDTVEQARTWALEKAQKDPVFGQQVEAAFKSEMLPVDWVVQQHKRDATLATIGDRSMDDFVRDYLSKNPNLLQSAPAPAAQAVTPQQASPPVKVPRSLATQGTGPSDIRQTATGALAGVDSLFS